MSLKRSVFRDPSTLKPIGLACGATVGLILIILLLYNQTRQRDTEQKLMDLQHTVEQSMAAKPTVASELAPRQMVERQPVATQGSSYLQRQRQIRDVLEEGWKLVDQRDSKQAAKAAIIFQEGLDDLDPNDPELMNGLGRALLVAGKPKEAIVAWRKGLAIDPKLAEMQSGIGWAYWNLHDPYDAKNAWEAALTLDSKSADAWSAMAWIYLGLQQKSKAQDGFKTLTEVNNKNMAWIQGMGMARAGNFDPAQIGIFFKLPPLETFSMPPTSEPVSTGGAQL